MNIAIFPGSFDPITLGHTDLAEQASTMFDKVIVAVSHNIQKKDFLPIETRKNLVQQSLGHLRNVEVEMYTGLTVDFAKKSGAKTSIRGLRNSADFEYEYQMAGVNQTLDKNIKTIFLLTKPEYSCISSSIVKDVFSNGGDVSKFVPKCVFEYLKTIR